MIHYLEERFGTDKLLNWASKIKDSKKAAETKLEILEVLAKKYGKDYTRFYNLEKQSVVKAINSKKIIRKPLKIRRL